MGREDNEELVEWWQDQEEGWDSLRPRKLPTFTEA